MCCTSFLFFFFPLVPVSVGSCTCLLLNAVVAFACPHTIGWFSPHSGKTFHPCALVGITVTTDNVLKGLESAWLASCLTIFTYKFWLIGNPNISTGIKKTF